MLDRKVQKLRSIIHNINAVAFFGAVMASATPPQENMMVLVSASVAIQSPSSGTITLNYPITTPGWTADWEVTGYKIYRKAKHEVAWGPPTDAPPTPHSFTETVPVGTDREYKVERLSRHLTYGFTVSSYGFIYAGLHVPPTHQRGKVLLLVDNSMAAPLASELTAYAQALAGDGWIVFRHDVPRGLALTDGGYTQQVRDMRAIIKAYYESDTANFKAVLLFGHVAVPYSGGYAPDGHSDHVGAWPADVYYGDVGNITGPLSWTDTQVNDVTPSRPENDNVPGDGKFDQNVVSGLGGKLALQIGRVDLANMPAFSLSETELLRRYLNKGLNFRNKVKNYERRGLLDVNLPWGADHVWRNFTTYFGLAQNHEVDWFSTLPTQTYLWAYGNGWGTFDSAAGVGTTANFAQTPAQAAFTMLFGSYFGDWDNQNNFLRAPLCNEDTLTCYWGNTINSFGYHSRLPMHHIALGETIGHSTLQAQIDSTELYYPQASSPLLPLRHLALMGDPTLRMHVAGPPSNLIGTRVDEQSPVNLTWTASTDSVSGYNVYRSAFKHGPFVLLNTSALVGGTFYGAPASSERVYMVRAVKLESTWSGTYTNLSQGAFFSFTGDPAPVILSHPASKTSTVGETIAIAVHVQGNGLFYQWKKNNVDIPGATAPVLVLRDIQTSDAGNYTVGISSQGGSVGSYPATLTVNQAPIVIPITTHALEETPIEIDVAGFITDPNSGPSPLSVKAIGLPHISGPSGAPMGGTASIIGTTSKILYTPYSGFTGADTFKYVVSDGQASVEGSITVHVHDTALATGLTRFGLTGTTSDYPGLPGNYSSRILSDGTFEVRAYGSGMDDGFADSGHTEWKTVTGDFEAITRVNAGLGEEVWAGLVVRECSTAACNQSIYKRFVSVLARTGYETGLEYCYRSQEETWSTRVQINPSYSYPAYSWLKLTRSGSQITAYISTDGLAWVLAGQPPVFSSPALASTVSVGLFANGVVARGVFSNFRILQMGTTDYVWPQPVQLSSGVRLGNGHFQFQIAGGHPNGLVGYVQRSSDLINWTDVFASPITVCTPAQTFTDTTASGVTTRFYRFRSSNSQIYSINSLGFTTLSFIAGWNKIGNNLDAPIDEVTAIFGSVGIPEGTAVYVLQSGGWWNSVQYVDSAWEGDLPLPWNTGEGAWVQTPTPFSVTFVGEARLNSLKFVPKGWGLIASMVPQSGLIDSALGWPNHEGDQIYLYLPEWAVYETHQYVDGAWEPFVPNVLLGQAIDTQLAVPRYWWRKIQLWNP